MTYDLGYVIVLMGLSSIVTFSATYIKYQKVINQEFNRGKEVGRASQRHTARV